jgi:phosphohistidine swiveling domain-containing protein
MTEMVRTFDELETEQLPLAGGKGGTLARLYQAGYPVPDGFVILPDAFAGDELTASAWSQVLAHLQPMRTRGIAFAVRSSALSEDSASASFAGEFETVLGVHSDEMIRTAIHTVRRSRHSERVRVYTKAKGRDGEHDMAVVVQELLRADISGVLFTADPVSGSRTRMMGNYIYGLGDELVSGEAEPYTFTLERPKGRYDGPAALANVARKLYKMASRLEKDLGNPQDIEWCIADGKLFLLQSRPITTLIAHDPTIGEWNCTLTGDYLWTSMMIGEIFPNAITPSTWSVWKVLLDNMSFGDTPTFGNIAGRLYLNYSLTYSLAEKLMGSEEKIEKFIGDSIGMPPDGVEIPPFPSPMKAFIFQVIPREIRNALKKARLKKDVAGTLSSVESQCQVWRQQIREMGEPRELIPLWREEIKPLFSEVHLLQDGLNEDLEGQRRKLKNVLTELVGERTANRLLTTISGGSWELTSLGPLLGLSKLRRGEIDRQEYLGRYGHRTANENELAEPRPYEDPGWLDRQLDTLASSTAEVADLVQRRGGEFEAAWRSIEQQMPTKKAQAYRHRIDQFIQTNAAREATRSELTRIVGVIRDLFLRAGQFAGLEDDAFYLTIDELAQVLTGDRSPVAYIPARRETHRKYRALPPLPPWIRGRFDPFQWAADPARRMDVFDASAPVSPVADTGGLVKGHPGSAGRVEGIVRRIDDPAQSEQLKPGEILVTSTTNVGWTPLFPRAAAVVTDIGAALSHAAIVAREIGIPAVVGCSNATMRLRTGDRVRVDGGQGTVEILDAA